MTLAHPKRVAVALCGVATLAFVSVSAAATRPSAPACAPRAAARGPTFVFGREGGNIRPSQTALYADGRVARGDAVAGLARLARVGGFWTLVVPAIRRPTRNPDAARQYVEVHLTCRSHRVEAAGELPTAMRQLVALLEAVAPARP